MATYFVAIPYYQFILINAKSFKFSNLKIFNPLHLQSLKNRILCPKNLKIILLYVKCKKYYFGLWQKSIV
jgi:hypothetical protein